MMSTPKANKQMPTELELAAHNEAGHAIVGRLQGQDIGPMWLQQVEGGQWGGFTEHLDFEYNVPRGGRLDWFPDTVYARLNIPKPQGLTPVSTEEKCTFKLAGPVAEKLLCEQRGINSEDVRIGKVDVEEAESFVRELPQEEAQKILHDAEVLAWRLLRDPACWRAVETLAQELEHAPNHALEEERIHSIVSQALLEIN